MLQHLSTTVILSLRCRMSRRLSTIRDVRWTAGVEPLKRSKIKEQPEVAAASEVGGASCWSFDEMMKRAEEAQLVLQDGDEGGSNIVRIDD